MSCQADTPVTADLTVITCRKAVILIIVIALQSIYFDFAADIFSPNAVVIVCRITDVSQTFHQSFISAEQSHCRSGCDLVGILSRHLGRGLSCSPGSDLCQVQTIIDNLCFPLIFISPDAVIIFHFFDVVGAAFICIFDQYDILVQMSLSISAGSIVIAVAHPLVKNSDIIGTAAGYSISGSNFVVACRLTVNAVGIGTHKELVSIGSIQIISSDSTVISSIVFLCLIIFVIEVDRTASKSSLILYSQGCQIICQVHGSTADIERTKTILLRLYVCIRFQIQSAVCEVSSAVKGNGSRTGIKSSYPTFNVCRMVICMLTTADSDSSIICSIIHCAAVCQNTIGAFAERSSFSSSTNYLGTDIHSPGTMNSNNRTFSSFDACSSIRTCPVGTCLYSHGASNFSHHTAACQFQPNSRSLSGCTGARIRIFNFINCFCSVLIANCCCSDF